MARSTFRRRGTKATQATISQLGLKDQLNKAAFTLLSQILLRRAARG
jgi:hypothetical protein